MRDPFPDVVEKGRVQRPGMQTPRGATYGAFYLTCPATRAVLFVMAGDAADWPFGGVPFEHVSAHARPTPTSPRRCPTWEEMCWLKGLFFRDDEWVVQYHPAAADHVNHHEHVLHLWRPVGVEVPRPPKECV